MPPDFIRQQRTERRRELRRYSTPAESLLWWYLRNRRLNGYKFRRQHHVGPYIVDFYNFEFSLAIEVDGDTHFTPEGICHDAVRDEYLRKCGLTILRFTNQEVKEDLEGVLEKILLTLRRHSSPSVKERTGRGLRIRNRHRLRCLFQQLVRSF